MLRHDGFEPIVDFKVWDLFKVADIVSGDRLVIGESNPGDEQINVVYWSPCLSDLSIRFCCDFTGFGSEG